MVSFADLMVTRPSKGKTKLMAIHGMVRWYPIENKLKKILSRSGLGPQGYPPVVLFKALILQQFYGLSDPMMEDMLYDRISFRDFCGLKLSDKIPDETTLCRFRATILGQTEALFQMVLEDLKRQGIEIKGGTIIDASVIPSFTKPPMGGTVSQTDPDAGWTKKSGKYLHGYKIHLSCDDENRIITNVLATSADVHDSVALPKLLKGDETSLTADKAYESQKHRALLHQLGIQDRLMFKAKRGGKQPEWQRQLNKTWGKSRGLIEGIFGTMKTTMGLSKTRYKGWERNQVHFDLLAIAYNLSRAFNILRPQRG